jgi:hypothetical protein
MPDVDPLAFAIRFALSHKPIGRDAKMLIRSLSEHEFEVLCHQVAQHLRQCRWRQLPPGLPATSDQFPPAQSARER